MCYTPIYYTVRLFVCGLMLNTCIWLVYWLLLVYHTIFSGMYSISTYTTSPGDPLCVMCATFPVGSIWRSVNINNNRNNEARLQRHNYVLKKCGAFHLPYIKYFLYCLDLSPFNPPCISRKGLNATMFPEDVHN